MRTLAIIPARGGSKRIPGKNRRDFAGVPLISWSIRFARSISQFDNVIVSTDDEAIAQLAATEGLPVPFMRSAALAGDTSTSASVVRHALDFEANQGRNYDLVALIQPTSPVRLKNRWDKAFSLMIDPEVDSVVGIVPARNHPFHTYSFDKHARLVPFLPGGDELRALRTQDLPDAYCLAGNLYLTRASVLRGAGTFFPPNTLGVVCDQPFEAMDIDTEVDWIVAETLTKYYGRQPCQLSL